MVIIIKSVFCRSVKLPLLTKGASLYYNTIQVAGAKVVGLRAYGSQGPSTRLEAPTQSCALTYDAEYNHIIDYTTYSQCDTSRLIDREPRPLEDLFIHYSLIASGDQVMRHGATRK